MTFYGLIITLVTKKARLHAGWGVRTRFAETFRRNNKDRLLLMLNSKGHKLQSIGTTLTLNVIIVTTCGDIVAQFVPYKPSAKN